MTKRPTIDLIARLGGVCLAAAGLSGCNDTQNVSNARAWKPIPAETVALMNAKGQRFAPADRHPRLQRRKRNSKSGR